MHRRTLLKHITLTGSITLLSGCTDSWLPWRNPNSNSPTDNDSDSDSDNDNDNDNDHDPDAEGDGDGDGDNESERERERERENESERERERETAHDHEAGEKADADAGTNANADADADADADEIPEHEDVTPDGDYPDPETTQRETRERPASHVDVGGTTPTTFPDGTATVTPTVTNVSDAPIDVVVLRVDFLDAHDHEPVETRIERIWDLAVDETRAVEITSRPIDRRGDVADVEIDARPMEYVE